MKKLLLSLLLLATVILPSLARAETISVTYTPNPLVIAAGDTTKHIVKVSLASAPPSEVTLKLNYAKDLVTPGKTEIKFTPTSYKDLDLGVTLTKSAAASTDLATGIAVSLFGQTADKKTSFTGTLNISSSGDVSSGSTINASDLPGSGLDLQQLVPSILKAIFTLLGMTAFFGLIYSGFLFITAGGDTAKAEKGRKNIIWSITGVILAVLAYAIVQFVVSAVTKLKLP